MSTLKISALISIVLGMLSILAIGAAILALTDIYPGYERALLTEWSILRICFGVFGVFHLSALITFVALFRFIKNERTITGAGGSDKA